MKKILALGLAAVLAAASLVSCGGNKNGTVDKIVLATGGNTGTYYGYGMAMSTILSDKTGIAFDVQPSGASKANIQSIQLGEVDIVLKNEDTPLIKQIKESLQDELDRRLGGG